MLYEVSFILNLEHIAYFLIGFGVAYLIGYGIADSKNVELDRARDRLAAKKEWIKMISQQRKANAVH